MIMPGCSHHTHATRQMRASCGRGQEAGKRLEVAANGFRERGLESVINRQDTVSAMNA